MRRVDAPPAGAMSMSATFTMTPSTGGGAYAPRNIVAVWVEDSTGAFVIDEIRTGPTFESVTPRVVFAGTPGAPNCYGDSMASLAQTYGGSAQSATALGFATVTALEAAVADYCTP